MVNKILSFLHSMYNSQSAKKKKEIKWMQCIMRGDKRYEIRKRINYANAKEIYHYECEVTPLQRDDYRRG